MISMFIRFRRKYRPVSAQVLTVLGVAFFLLWAAQVLPTEETASEKSKLYVQRDYREKTRWLKPEAEPPWSAAAHNSFANHVLMVREPSVLGANSEWTFASILAQAGVLGTISDPPQAFWDGPRKVLAPSLESACADESSPQTCLLKAPLELLAIVNRLDTAKIAGTAGTAEVTDAELRFIYGHEAVSVDASSFVIVEFVLRPVTPKRFASLVKTWADLDPEASASPDHFPAHLLKAVQSTLALATSARIRIEMRGPSPPASWKFHQFDASAGQWQPAPLFREVLASRVYNLKDKDITSNELGTFINDNLDQIASGEYALTADLNTFSESASTDVKVLTLSSNVAKDVTLARREEIRRILSLNTCTGCHSGETNTEFVHIGRREKGQVGKMSRFLTGTSEPGSFPPTEIATGFFQVEPKRREISTDQTVYRYNDLRRRHEFFDAILRLGSQGETKIEVWKQTFETFLVQQSH